METRSIEFNNAGVDCIEAGHHKVAWDLFKGALEVKLASERMGFPNRNSADGSEPSCQRYNSYVQKAESHLLNIDSYLKKDDDLNSTTRNMTSFVASQGVNQESRQSIRADLAQDSLYVPFLFRRPMKLLPGQDLTPKRESATIIFNLALIDHLKNRCSEQAVQLYELAMTLLTGDTVDALGIALMNNIGVWCYENGDTDGALTCMGHLASFIGSCSSCINQEQKDGLQANILWLTNPPFAASPAA